MVSMECNGPVVQKTARWGCAVGLVVAMVLIVLLLECFGQVALKTMGLSFSQEKFVELGTF